MTHASARVGIRSNSYSYTAGVRRIPCAFSLFNYFSYVLFMGDKNNTAAVRNLHKLCA